MKKSFNFDELFVLDLANNHQGDVAHGLRIISELGKVTRNASVRAGLKFQFRNLDTFIHPDHKDGSQNKHVPRFLGTRLAPADYRQLADAVKQEGMITIATPFDESSVDLITDLDIDIVKIASCSATDTPLLNKVAEARRPVIVSTAGLSISELDHLVSLLSHRNVEFALMHCVAIYPTPGDKLRLNQIETLRNRYPHVVVGFSTHEDQTDMVPVQVAYAKGARIFERHVGMSTEKYQLNAYSSEPGQVAEWIAAFQNAKSLCGGVNRAPAPVEEKSSLRSLARGVFATKALKQGEVIKREDVFFAMPISEGQLESGKWRDSIIADRDYAPNESLSSVLAEHERSSADVIYDIILQVKGILNQARIAVKPESSVEISHHYGLERFREFGAIIIDVINREYCKKLLVMLPRQKHPYHYHKKKEETFQLLFGDMEIEADGHVVRLEPGDTFLVKPGTWHKFHTLDGAVVEEISTTHFKNDSFYEDERIAALTLDERKTKVPYFIDTR
jgi:sialic acid synthase SpsE/quercetin dioxygenase-like cupin family protein